MDDLLSRAGKAAEAAAREAGKVLLGHHGQKLQIEIKDNNPRNLVTNADKEADAAISAILKSEFPEAAILSEEGSHIAGEGYTWHVDPLDGTTNYSRGGSYFCVSIGLAKGREILAGVIYAPVTGELYSAMKGRGAFLNGRRIKASGVDDFSSAVVCTDLGYNIARRERMLAAIVGLSSAKSIRLKGSGALAMCEVAQGSADAYVHLGSKSWDFTAGALILKEAGGTVTDFHGREWNPEVTEGIIAANNNAVARQLLEKVKQLAEAGA